ncbi:MULTISPECIES: TetR/AcrR family transcriptional regulator [Streptomyces]|uniref:TetR family transcriptional regulator n=2 Tax=Streptomyces rapamycinicus TaxID=1226757 RepID=A0A0A0NE90_STRRN|nr:TetR/AcrR family transcriptional regulator [Streptomyces rapamycinicus]AGP55304.1 TetR family transcriptional regulator [Streptomyces rapamycinicus NRRL 5491]MBB4782856.1 AcrR family transcriptional regulator [Streptomyces rapamycinicus]RLV81664.1 TetR family transcriptional regulator [Streptomyces rapamycinicus NRRL 5491]UTO63323.1 TetR family transcriptional regulator [Streptomyces rapamycinicus]UTP31281.1 TetR family transcriptional regulator [Streptomyces rapamycinicus NRRL 5491]
MSDQPPKNSRLRDAVRTQAEILDVATREFAERGYAGARVDEIAALTRTTKRMIYYYFGGKEQLYIKVLERAYTGIREAEQAVDVTGLDPAEAIRHLAELTFDHHTEHADFIRLVSIENIHRAEHLAKSETLAKAGTPVIDLISGILARGREQGVFRDDADAVDVHMMISSFAVFPVANQHTFGTLFGRDPLDPGRRAHYRRMVGDMVVAYLRAGS